MKMKNGHHEDEEE